MNWKLPVRCPQDHKLKSPVRKWNAGDRVTRTVYSDDGTWQREGDACLPFSPRYHGVVIGRSGERDDEVLVVFDGTTHAKRFLDHGLDAE